jgi:hypothetical protein
VGPLVLERARAALVGSDLPQLPEEDSLAELTAEAFDEAMAAYGPGRTSRFLVGLRKELKL